ncbi:hypothetical protein [Flexivirga endophytica]|uniref:hypothetical protein n=1 Tax=Flexivirga endophytica TaxID=1849103 RepID=UPI00166DF076|nr:hypothetical protein [Flexivirga endophytica]GHB68333.1 hypothetical protein GCM10008112_41360 [Flexivirga endophytica]
MPGASLTESPASRLATSSLALGGGVLTAALVVIGAYAGSDVAAYAVLATGLALAWGWPLLLGLPRPTGTSLVLAAACLGMAGVVVFSGDDDGMQALSVVLAGGLVLAFLHQLVRTDGREDLTVSLAGCSFGLVLLASGMFSAGAAPYDQGDAAVAVAIGAAALGLLADAVLPEQHAVEWSWPVSVLLGVLVGLVVGLVTGDLSLNILLLTGLVAGFAGAAIRRVLRLLDTDDPAGRLSYGIAAVLSTGVLAYAAQYLINR